MDLVRHRRGKISDAAAVLRREFSDPAVRKGMLAPSARECARRFGISIPTAHEVLKQLAVEGIVYRVRGSGTFIRKTPGAAECRIGLLECPSSPVPPGLTSVYNSEIANITRYMKKSGWAVRNVSYPELQDRKTAMELLRSFDGMLISRTYVDDYSLPLFRKSGVPFVVFRLQNRMPEEISQSIPT